MYQVETDMPEKQEEGSPHDISNQYQCHQHDTRQDEQCGHRVSYNTTQDDEETYKDLTFENQMVSSIEERQGSGYDSIYRHETVISRRIDDLNPQGKTKPSKSEHRGRRIVPSDSVPIIEQLLKRMDTLPISDEILVAAVSAWNVVQPEDWDAQDTLILLLQHNRPMQISEKVLETAARNSRGCEMLDLLLELGGNASPTNTLSTESLAHPDVHATSWKGGSQLQITENVLLTAIKNSAIPADKVLALLLGHTDGVKQENIILAVIQRSKRDPDLLTSLLRHRSDVRISENIILEAIEYGWRIFDLLMTYSHMKTTEAMLRAAVEHPHTSVEVVNFLLAHRQGCEIDDSITTIGYTRERSNPEILNPLRKAGGEAPHSTRSAHLSNKPTPLEGRIRENIPSQCLTCFDLDFPTEFPEGMMMADIIRTADKACRYCSMLRKLIEEMIADFDPEHMSSVVLDPNYDSDTSHLLLDVWTGLSNTAVKLEIYRQENTPIFSPFIGIGCSVQKNASADGCIALANQWLKDCTENHTGCAVSLTPLPTRVIKVGSSTTPPSLHISNGEIGRFIALSHCWGKGVTVTTTKQNIDSMCREIAFDTLPDTFQNAIIITRKLSIEYLWIDSLCIIQDSPEDWNKEAARMTQVYHNSTITIAADGMAKPSSGCYAPFDTIPHKRNVSIEIPCINSDGVLCSVYVRRRLQKDPDNGAMAHGEIIPPNISKELVRSELNSRGWTLQERLLAPRILHYSSTELAWECATQLQCECSMRPTYGNAFKSRFFGGIEKETITADSSQDESDQDSPEMIQSLRSRQWAEMVHEFTARKLTYNTDRLPAVSGLAGYMQINPSDEYVCGLWRATLARDLLWIVQDDTSKRPRSRLHERLSGPSWSWAAVSNRVKFLNYAEQEWKEDVEVLDINYDLMSENNPFGRVDRGVLTVRALLVPVWATSPGYGDVRDGMPLVFCDREGTGQHSFLELGRVLPDVVDSTGAYPEVRLSEQLVLLPLLKCTFSMERACIVLRKSGEEENTFQRIGILGGVHPWHHPGRTNFSVQEVFWGLWDELSERQVVFIK